MTKEETIKIMAMLGAFYSGGKNNAALQAEAWYMILGKYDYMTAQKAVLAYAENDTREHATFPAVGVIVKEIKRQQLIENRPYKEIIRSVQYGTMYGELSADAKRIISEIQYNDLLEIEPEYFANNAMNIEKSLKNNVKMIGG